MKKENKSIWVWSEIADEVMKSHYRIKEEECSLRSGDSSEISLMNKYFRLTVTFSWHPESACVEWAGVTGEPYTYGQYDINDINYDIEIEGPVLVTNLENYDDEEVNLTDEQEEKMIKIINDNASKLLQPHITESQFENLK
tara:strand:- start:365 stop:787 length:423 start_codon:yes stop_codon:yes gene_type:complete